MERKEVVMKSYSKRLTILSEQERFALYDLPDFNEEQQNEYFIFTSEEQELIFSRSDSPAQLYCALQIGYFKAKQIFFDFSWNEISDEDIDFLIMRHFNNKHFSLEPITKYEYYAQTNQIAKLCGYTLWSTEYTEQLYSYVVKTARRDINVNFILTELLQFMCNKKIVRPGYSTLQKIIGKAINDEYRRLDNIMINSINDESKQIIEKLLVREDIFSYLAVLKQDAKSFGYKMMVAERQKVATIKPIYLLAKELLPKLDISNQNLLYFADLVDYYDIFDLRRFSLERLHLYVLCYIWQRYMQLTDNLIDAFGYHLKQFDEETKESAEDNFTDQARHQQGKMPLIGKLLQLYIDKNISDDITFGEIRKKYVFSLMKEEAIYNTAQQMLYKPISEHTLKWKAVDKISHKFKKHLRATFMELDFASSIPDNPLLTVANHLKQTFLSQKPINRNNLELCASIIPKKLRQHLVFTDKAGKITSIQPNRYEFWIYRQITKRLESGELYLDDSVSHRCFEHELVPLIESEINQLELPCLQSSIESQIDELCKELKNEWILFDKMLKQNKLKHIEYDSIKKTISFHKPLIDKIEEPESTFYSQLPPADITDILRFVNGKCNFLSALNPIQSRYTKSTADEDILLAVIIAQSMNHGRLKLSKISDISYHQMSDAYNKYFRKSTLKESSKIISNGMSKLLIFPYYSFDLTTLYGSVDGQKLEVDHPTVKARHSKKHFGKGKGVVSYTMLVNHNPAMGELIGSHQHESYYVFDVYYNNITDIVPNAITGDMHSINKANFALLHWFKTDFRPRFTDLEVQLNHLYCGDDLSNYQDFWVKPVAQIDRKLIEEEWHPKIKQIIATLANKEITQSKIIKKLCTYKQTRTLKAIFEFDKLIRSIYTLKYLRDTKLQRDVHRSQNRIESYHQLRAAISQVNGKKQLCGKTDIEIDISNECGRLVANAIIYYNSELLSLLLQKYQACGDSKAIERLKKISPVAWQHIHMLGHYIFCNNKNPINLEEIISIFEFFKIIL